MTWRVTRFPFTISMAFALLVCGAPSVYATPILVGSVTVTETESGFLPTSDTVTIGPGLEISGGDGTNIGGPSGGGGILFTGEYIDIGPSSIVFNIFGGDTVDGPYPTGYSGTDYGPDAAYTFSNISLNPLGQIVGLSYVLHNIVENNGTSTGTTTLSPTDLSFTANSITVGLGLLDVLNNVGAGDLGQLTINIQTSPNQTQTPVPEPSTMSMGLLGLGLMAGWSEYRRRHVA